MKLNLEGTGISGGKVHVWVLSKLEGSGRSKC